MIAWITVHLLIHGHLKVILDCGLMVFVSLTLVRLDLLQSVLELALRGQVRCESDTEEHPQGHSDVCICHKIFFLNDFISRLNLFDVDVLITFKRRLNCGLTRFFEHLVVMVHRDLHILGYHILVETDDWWRVEKFKLVMVLVHGLCGKSFKK
jgi:hypothetical protein